jgi:hypothetical protein
LMNFGEGTVEGISAVGLLFLVSCLMFALVDLLSSTGIVSDLILSVNPPVELLKQQPAIHLDPSQPVQYSSQDLASSS